MRSVQYAGMELPLVEREKTREQARREAVHGPGSWDPRLLDFSHLPKALGRYDNWEQDPDLTVAAASHDMVKEMRRQGQKVVFSEDGFKTYLDRRGRMREMGPVRGGDIVTYVTCPSVSVADGGATAASVSIQALPNGVSPLFAGAGGATGGTGGFWYPGRTIQYTLMGRGTTAATPGNTVFQCNIATSQNVTTGNALGGTTSIALAASLSNITFVINGWATCRSIGTAGALMGIGQISLGTLATTNVLNMLPLNTPATAAVDTTANSAMNFLLTLGATTVSFTVHMMVWQVMN